MFTNRSFVERKPYYDNIFSKSHQVKPRRLDDTKAYLSTSLDAASGSALRQNASPFYHSPQPRKPQLSPSPLKAGQNTNWKKTVSEFNNAWQQTQAAQNAITLSRAGFYEPVPLEPKRTKIAEKHNSIFMILTQSSYTNNFKTRAGYGFLITPNLAITTHQILPSQDYAARSVLFFLDTPQTFFRFYPTSAFYTVRDLNFTVVAVQMPPSEEKYRQPIFLHEDFYIRERDQVFFYTEKGGKSKPVVLVENFAFTYGGGEDSLAGYPVFSANWDIQGLHHTSTLGYKYNQCTRIDTIFRNLASVPNLKQHPEYDVIFMQRIVTKAKDLSQTYEVPQPIKPSQYIYWFQWYTQNIFKYELETAKWQKLTPSNSLGLAQSKGEWYFNWNSRFCYTENGDVFIVGGLADQSGYIKDDVWFYQASNNHLVPVKPLTVAKDSPAIVYYRDELFVIGGRYETQHSEKYSTTEEKWIQLSDVNLGRFEHSACVVSAKIYVCGGYPESTSRSVECYDIRIDQWTILDHLIPEPVTYFGMFPLVNGFAILGGKSSRQVIKYDVDEGSEIAWSLQDQAMCIFPVVYRQGNLFILTGTNGYSQLKVLVYAFRNVQ